jgi:uroporphyrinogen-III synthase
VGVSKKLSSMKKNIYLFSISSHPDAISVNSLDVKLLKPDIDFAQYDYFIITSKQTSKALKQYKDIDLKPALCVSVASAASYEEIGGKVLDIGGGYGDNLVDKIKQYKKTTKWLYLSAKVVASDFVDVCKKDGYDIKDIVVYESGCSKAIDDIVIGENPILIFTSPSSVKCFLKKHTIEMNSKIIVIGKTTAKALPKGLKYTISDTTTINSCIDIAKNL